MAFFIVFISVLSPIILCCKRVPIWGSCNTVEDRYVTSALSLIIGDYCMCGFDHEFCKAISALYIFGHKMTETAESLADSLSFFVWYSFLSFCKHIQH